MQSQHATHTHIPTQQIAAAPNCRLLHVPSPSPKVVYKVRVNRLFLPSELAEEGSTSKIIEPFGTASSSSTTTKDWPVYVELTNGEIYGADLIVSAIGVDASFHPGRVVAGDNNGDDAGLSERKTILGASFAIAAERLGGGLLVNEQMQTDLADVYAAGDCAYANWDWAPTWFQMRLWSQARLMGFQVRWWW